MAHVAGHVVTRCRVVARGVRRRRRMCVSGGLPTTACVCDRLGARDWVGLGRVRVAAARSRLACVCSHVPRCRFARVLGGRGVGSSGGEVRRVGRLSARASRRPRVPGVAAASRRRTSRDGAAARFRRDPTAPGAVRGVGEAKRQAWRSRYGQGVESARGRVARRLARRALPLASAGSRHARCPRAWAGRRSDGGRAARR